MRHQKINRVCAMVPIVLSLTAFVWVLGNVSGGARSGGGEGTGFYIFWLLILMEIPFVPRVRRHRRLDEMAKT